MDYLEAFRQRQQRYMNSPMHVHVETTGVCNARCTFCPYTVMDRRGKRMSDELFAKIVSDLKELPADAPLAISPFKVNEPLLDPKIFQRMDTLADELPHAFFWLTSNFNVVDDETLEQLAKVRRLNYIWISLNSLREDEYKQWMGLELSKTVENIKRLIRVNRKKRFVPQIVLSRVGDGTGNDKRFVLDIASVFAQFKCGSDYLVGLTKRGQWMGFTDSKSPDISSLPCQRWFELSMTCTGEVAFCCMDGLCEHALGDLNKQSVLDVYNRPDYLKLRKTSPPRKDVDTCKNCTFL